MNSRLWRWLLPLILAICAGSLRATDVRVSAAASLAEALKEIAVGYETKSGDKVIYNFGGSNVLARQIEEGAPVDVFFSADEAKMDGLAQKGLIVPETRKSRLSNTLVIVVAADGTTEVQKPADLAGAGIKRVALADPKAVPAGIYARQWLDKLGLWNVIESKVVPTENVRGALAAVEAGNAEAGIIYRTDAGVSNKVKIAYALPSGDGPAISYPVALLKDAPNALAARMFLDHLGGAAAAAVFEKFGFIVLK